MLHLNFELMHSSTAAPPPSSLVGQSLTALPTTFALAPPELPPQRIDEWLPQRADRGQRAILRGRGDTPCSPLAPAGPRRKTRERRGRTEERGLTHSLPEGPNIWRTPPGLVWLDLERRVALATSRLAAVHGRPWGCSGACAPSSGPSGSPCRST